MSDSSPNTNPNRDDQGRWLPGHGEPSEGRPPLYESADITGRVLAAVRAGCTYAIAARAAGIDQSTYHNWEARWRRAREAGGEVPEALGAFFDALEIARAEGEVFHAANIHRVAEVDWKASGWLLERRHPERWGRRDRHDLTGVAGGAAGVKIEISLLGSARDGGGAGPVLPAEQDPEEGGGG